MSLPLDKFDEVCYDIGVEKREDIQILEGGNNQLTADGSLFGESFAFMGTVLYKNFIAAKWTSCFLSDNRLER